ncbi:MAG: polysaccharide biosynthesis tyrosine autokinase [Mycolicibacterium neoaurum]|uniref:polysaccharide biosynthesis tyrosine autokinase n=1 Tax=Mycolicibacterium neoaurum TaxID=1795 RepID=UPI002FF44053
MTLQDFVKLLRARWITMAVTVAAAVLGALAFTLLTTPQYQASTRLFVSASGGDSVADTYQGNRLSQERVLSYAELLMGETLAQRTIDKLNLDLSASSLRARVKATAKPETVLIDVKVQDPSPVQARDIANVLSDEFVTMVRELETPEDGSRPDARVVVEQRASIPEKPISPNLVNNLLLALAFGVVAGVGVAVLRGLLDNTVKDRETLEQVTGVGMVGIIPSDKERRKDPPISFGQDNSAIAEAFRKLRTNLQFLAVDNPPRVIVVTSSMPGEGKSTSSINIALALAEAEHNVLIVDGDMRRPKLDKYLNLVGQAGLSTVLSGKADLSDVLQKTRFPGLTALTCGTIPPNPSELLGSMAAKKLLAEMRGQFDYVVIDSSPLLAVTDAAILAAEADGVLIMARFGQAKRDQLAHAIANLEHVGARTLGAVLTMAPERGDASYSYTYYGQSEAERSARSAVADTAASSTGSGAETTESTSSNAHQRQEP